MMPDIARRIRDNLAEVRGRIAAAAVRSGRPADAVTLVAVTKFVGPPAIQSLVDAGCTQLGESRPQHLWEKAADLADLAVHWHMIGHLQRNKVKRTLPLISMLHSGDSPELIVALDRHAAEEGMRLPLLIEVNISGDVSKHGFESDAVEPFLAEAGGLPNIEVRGLMGMGSLEGGIDQARRDFAALRRLRDRLASRCPPAIRLEELSMGMSGDYEAAVEEGATIVRVGSALFEGIPP
jgi:pyridoxal phosphate enzyme (YggS family)